MFSIFPTLTEIESDNPTGHRVYLTETGEQVEVRLDGMVLIVRWDDRQQFVRVTNDGRCEHYDRRPTYGPRRPVAPTYRRPAREGRPHFDRFGEYCGTY